MAIGTPAAVEQATRGTGTANLVTGTITFTTDSIFYVFGFGRNAGSATFSNSQTLTMTAVGDDGTSRLYAQSFTGDGSSGTVTFNAGAGPAVLQVIEVTGCDETVVQFKVGNAWGGGSNNAGVTFDTTPASTSVSIAAVGFDSGTFTSSDTEIQQDQAGGDGLATAFTTGTDDTVAWTHGGTTKSSIGLELAEASGGGPTTTPKVTTYTALGTSSLSTITTFLMQPNFTAAGTPSIIKTISKFFSMSSIGTSSIQKTVGKDINVTAIGTATQQEGLITTQSISSTATGTLITATSLIIGIGGTIKRISRYIVRNIVRNITRLIGAK